MNWMFAQLDNITLRWAATTGGLVGLAVSATVAHMRAASKINKNADAILYLSRKDRIDTLLLMRIANKVGVNTDDIQAQIAKIDNG